MYGSRSHSRSIVFTPVFITVPAKHTHTCGVHVVPGPRYNKRGILNSRRIMFVEFDDDREPPIIASCMLLYYIICVGGGHNIILLLLFTIACARTNDIHLSLIVWFGSFRRMSRGPICTSPRWTAAPQTLDRGQPCAVYI